MNNTNTNIAWTRSTFTALWAGAVLWVVGLLGWEVDISNPTVIIAIGLIGSIVWRLSMELARIPWLGYVLFGINKAPGYDLPVLPNPETQADPPVDEHPGI